MQGRLENQMKAEHKINEILSGMPGVIRDYYISFSVDREYRSCLDYLYKINRFLNWYSDNKNININKIKFKEITDTDIGLFFKEIETKETKKGTEYTSFSYRKQYHSVLNSLFDFLYKKGITSSNPVQLIKRPTKEDKVNHIFLQREDLDKIISAIINGAGTDKAINCQMKWKERDLAIFYTFILTGMRESALCEIDLNRIDFENNVLEVTDKEHKINTYSIPQKLKTVLLEWIEKRNELLNGEELDALFISNQRKRITQNTVRAILHKYSEEALGYKVNPHRLRAAYGNIIYEKTKDIELTSKAMKHSNISTTRIYLENNESKINTKVKNIMEEIF